MKKNDNEKGYMKAFKRMTKQKELENLENELQEQQLEIENKLLHIKFIKRVLAGEDEDRVVGEASQIGINPIDLTTQIKYYKGE